MKKVIFMAVLLCGFVGFALGQNTYTTKNSPISYTKFTVTMSDGVANVSRQEIKGSSADVKSSLYNLAGLDFSQDVITIPEGNYWFVPISGKAINVGGRTIEATCKCKNSTEGSTSTSTSTNDCVIRTYGGNIRTCDGTLCTCCSLEEGVSSGAGLLIFASSINLK